MTHPCHIVAPSGTLASAGPARALQPFSHDSHGHEPEREQGGASFAGCGPARPTSHRPTRATLLRSARLPVREMPEAGHSAEVVAKWPH
jgi:hypothetical protein